MTIAYLGADIRNHLGDGSEFEMQIEYVVEDRPLGTAGSVRNAAHLLDETFLVISGDALTDIDLTSVVRQHRERKANASIVLRSVPNPLEYGVVVTDPEGNVVRFLEKPSWGEVFSDQANTGIYVAEPSVLGHIKPDTVADWSQDVFPAMLRRREPLIGIAVEDYWCDIGSIQSYMQANWDALDGKVRCHIPGRREGEAWIGEGVEFGYGCADRGTGVHRRRGETQGRRVHQRSRGHRPLHHRRRLRQGQQQHHLAALVHRRAVPPAPGDRVPQRHGEEQHPARREQRHR